MNDRIDVLLVEDNPSDAKLTLKALSHQTKKPSVLHVEDGVEALDFVFAKGRYSNRNKDQHPKVIFLDIKLPKLNGFDVLRELKNNDSTKHIPIVMLTSSKEQIDLKTCYNLGVNSFIVKPIDYSKYLDTIQEAEFYWNEMNEVMNN